MSPSDDNDNDNNNGKTNELTDEFHKKIFSSSLYPLRKHKKKKRKKGKIMGKDEMTKIIRKKGFCPNLSFSLSVLLTFLSAGPLVRFSFQQF